MPVVAAAHSSALRGADRGAGHVAHAGTATPHAASDQTGPVLVPVAATVLEPAPAVNVAEGRGRRVAHSGAVAAARPDGLPFVHGGRHVMTLRSRCWTTTHNPNGPSSVRPVHRACPVLPMEEPAAGG